MKKKQFTFRKRYFSETQIEYMMLFGFYITHRSTVGHTMLYLHNGLIKQDAKNNVRVVKFNMLKRLTFKTTISVSHEEIL